MNKLVFASLVVTAGMFSLAPRTAKAGGDEAWAALGGFIGGVIVGSAIDDDSPPAFRDHARYPRGGGSHVVIEVGARPRGHWEWVEVRTWVPGRWVVSFDDCGRRHRRWMPGYHDCRRERVWVDGSRRRDQHRDRDRFSYRR